MRRLTSHFDDNLERLNAHRASEALAKDGVGLDLTVEEFRALPYRESWNNEDVFDLIVILPAGDADETHASGYRNMDFVGVRNGNPICRLSGSSDVLHLDGIGGLGGQNPSQQRRAWGIDCLPKSGLLRLWCNRKTVLRAGSAMSSFGLFVEDKDA